MGQYFVARFLSISEIIIQSAIDTNIILTATISCTIYLLPLKYTKKFADEKDTKHANQRDSLGRDP